MSDSNSIWTRRDFVKGTGVAALAATLPAGAFAASGATLRVGLIGCGGRGTGAAHNIMQAGGDEIEIVALADVFADRLESSRKLLAGVGPRGKVAANRCYVGFDAYKQLLESDVDIVILATPPHFRPIHLSAAVDAGKHVFMEKPAAVDGPGVRLVMDAGDRAAKRGLCIVAGTQRRHEKSYRSALDQVKAGAIGRIVAASCYWNMGGLWMKPREAVWTDMEWQLRNWLYFTWLSGDHITEQHVHNLDVVNWAMGTHPERAMGMGGRQVRTDPAYGHIFDHFAIEYIYPDGMHLTSMCRQIDGCENRVEERLHGTDGQLITRPGFAVIEHGNDWRFDTANPNPYVQEHVDLLEGIRSGRTVNEARQVAESTLTAIMGRMAVYTGKEVTWEQALNSRLDLSPPAYELGPLPTPPVAVPGKTELL